MQRLIIFLFDYHLSVNHLSLSLSLSRLVARMLIFSSSITSGEEEEEEEEGCVRWKRGPLWISSSPSAGSHLQYAQHLAAGRSPLRAHGTLFRGSSGSFSNYHDRPLFLVKKKKIKDQSRDSPAGIEANRPASSIDKPAAHIDSVERRPGIIRGQIQSRRQTLELTVRKYRNGVLHCLFNAFCRCESQESSCSVFSPL